jgi:glutamine cyclotransferase
MGIIFIVILLLIILSIILFRFHLFNLLIKHSQKIQEPKGWIKVGPTPGMKDKDSPQGLTYYKGKLIFANSWKNKKSRVYIINKKSMRTEKYFDMPKEAVHTSGLTLDKNSLWAVDYKSNFVYCINLKESIKSGQAKIIGKFKSPFKGTSACCFVKWNNKICLAISDFMRTRQTIFIDYKKSLKEGNVKNSIVFSYTNEGFSQGLEFINGYLFESENKIGKNVINQIDLKLLKKNKSSFKSTIKQYIEPGWGVEDLAWDGENLWTSDEKTYQFYKRKL